MSSSNPITPSVASIETVNGTVSVSRSGGDSSNKRTAEREMRQWFEANICRTCPRFCYPGGAICQDCNRTDRADASYPNVPPEYQAGTAS